ncbi:MAG: TIGR03576 family pyridoxal phosphate-dependent enzyme [Methanobacteriaceae archaeon]
MLVNSSRDEVKRRETALRYIAELVNQKGRENLFDLTGLAGGFPLNKGDIDLLETYAGPALFEDDLDRWGKKHLGGEKLLALNRTSSGILASILALVRPGQEVVHYLPEKPSHPSIPRSCQLVGASYREYAVGEELKIGDNTSLLVITGSTMDHRVLSQDDLEMAINAAHHRGVLVLVDDASGARLRTVIYGQPRATDLGADLVITSTDKLMEGPRGGLMAGKTSLIDLVKIKAHQFGLEAQPPLMAAMARALEKFNPENITMAMERKDQLHSTLIPGLGGLEKTPTGVMLTPQALMATIGVETDLTPQDAAMLLAMLLLKEENILTIPAVGMPGASATIRLDLASPDADRLSDQALAQKLQNAMESLRVIINDRDACLQLLYH